MGVCVGGLSGRLEFGVMRGSVPEESYGTGRLMELTAENITEGVM